MIQSGISRQLLIAGTIPAAVVTAIVGVWLVTLWIGDLRDHQAALGEAVATQLAPAAEYGVFSGNTAVLKRLAEAALGEADLRAVTIRDRVGMVLAQAVQPNASHDPGFGWRLVGHLMDPDATMRFSAPIVQALTDLGEFDLPGLSADETLLGSVEIEVSLRPSIARQADAVLAGAALLLAGLMASLLLARRLGKRVATPIQRLADAMRRVRDGDLGVRVPMTSTNEIEMLESGLNRMANEVQRTQRTLEARVARATADLQQTVGALEISNVKLDLARRRALEANHLKSEFLAAMSHEIRTPMSGIIGFADLLARTALTEAQLDQVLTIKRSADALMRILNDILDLSRIEAGKLTLSDEPFDVRACIDEALSLMAPLAYAKRLDLRRGVAREVPRTLRGDPMRIQQVVNNLVSNAIKYTSVGSVTLDAALQSGEPVTLRICVTDTGVGIAPSVQRRMFHAFSQPTPTATHHPGSGLGLVICNKLVEAMGGEIELHSEPGRGSAFTVTLALALAATPDAQPRWEGVTAAVVDPDPLTRDHLAQLLEAEGIMVEAGGYDSLTTAARADLLLLGLPDFDVVDLDDIVDAARRYGQVVVLAGTHDSNLTLPIRERLSGACIARCSTPATLYRTLAGLLDGPAAATPPRVQSLGGIRALVVDDNQVNRVLLSRQLEALGATTATASDGAAAIAECSANRYDVVLLDMQMPEMGGMETAQRLKALAATPLIIAVTANAQPAVHRHPYAAGISAVLLKPVDEEILAATILGHNDCRQQVRTALAKLDADIVHMLAEDLPPRAQAFHAAALADDLASLRTEAHALRGIASVCHLRPLTDALGKLDHVTNYGHAALPELLAAAGAELVAVESLLAPME